MRDRLTQRWTALKARRELRAEFRGVQFAGLALQYLLDNFSFTTVLDIGSGAGAHSRAFTSAGKQTTSLDYGGSPYFAKARPNQEVIVGDYLALDFPARFDCVWASHVLEHQFDPHGFLTKIHGDLKEGGVLAITVPPLKHQIVGGHVTLWNAGLLLYRLVLAGFDTTDARVRSYGYNVSVLLEKRSIELPALTFDTEDLAILSPYLPRSLRGGPFDGAIRRLNW